jgi:hypothetical protein
MKNMISNLENLKSINSIEIEENLYELDDQLNIKVETVGEILSIQERVAFVTGLEKNCVGVNDNLNRIIFLIVFKSTNIIVQILWNKGT